MKQRAADFGASSSARRSGRRKASMTKSPSLPTAATGSLLSPTAMGGIVGGKGFDFQTRYAVCHLPLWLQDGAFHQILAEGTGDIDIRYVENGKSRRKHIQTKDHEVP